MTYEEWDHRTVPDPALAALISIRHWSRLEDLARFAVERHGFGDSNGGFGITYPTDLDEYDHEVDKITIPDGHVLAYGFFGEREPQGGYDVFVPQTLYLTVLADELTCAGFEKAAASVRTISRDLKVW